MMVLELSHKLLVHIPAYRHVQENVLGRIIRCGVCHRLTILECGLSALEVRRLQCAGEPALVVVLAVAVSRRLGVRQVRRQTIHTPSSVGLAPSVGYLLTGLRALAAAEFCNVHRRRIESRRTHRLRRARYPTSIAQAAH